MPEPPADALRRIRSGIGALVRWAGDDLYLRLAERAGIALDRPAITVLYVVGAHGPMARAQLAASVSLDSEALDAALAQLADLGLVAADPGAARSIAVTREGAELHRRFDEGWTHEVARLVDAWPEHDVEHLGRLLDRLRSEAAAP